MTTVTINERTAKGKSLLEFLRKFEGENFIRIGDEPNAETLKAISAISRGKGKRHKTVDSLMSDLMAD
jgi:hypothetical protein